MIKRKNGINSPYTGYLFILPQFIFFAVFMIYPILEGFRISLFKKTAVREEFVGLDNYIRLFQDSVFIRSIFNTLFLVFVVTSATIILGLIISTAIFDKNTKYISFVRSCYYLPIIVSTVVMSMVWNFLLNPASGLINYLLRTFDIGIMNPLGNKQYVLWIIAFVTLVASLGQAIIMYVASMVGTASLMMEINPNFAYKMAGATVACIPMLLVFIIFQGFFTRGITVGAVKE